MFLLHFKSFLLYKIPVFHWYSWYCTEINLVNKSFQWLKIRTNCWEFVEKSRDPIVLVWLGTCEFTGKKRKYISIRHYNYKYQNVEYTLDEYRELLSKIKKVNPTATVIFLECPYSIYAYNSRNNTINRTSTDSNNNCEKRSLTTSN